jgi:hypothetical protein
VVSFLDTLEATVEELKSPSPRYLGHTFHEYSNMLLLSSTAVLTCISLVCQVTEEGNPKELTVVLIVHAKPGQHTQGDLLEMDVGA